jgi:acyl carrier protein
MERSADAPPARPTSGLAVASLVCGVLGLLPVLPVIGSIIAIVTGHMARAQIARADGRVGGKGLATAGLFLGYSVVALLFTVAMTVGLALLLYVGSASRVDFEIDPVARALKDLPATASVEEKVLTVVGEQLGYSESDVTLDSSLEELEADETDIAEIVQELEEAFAVKLTDEEVQGLVTVGDLVKLIEEKLAEAPEGPAAEAAPGSAQAPAMPEGPGT